MKIVQKILSHGLLIAFFVAVFFIYLYRGELFPQWFDQQAQTEAAPATASTSPEPVAEQPRSAQSSVPDDEAQLAQAVPAEPVAVADEQPPTEPLAGAAPEAAPATAPSEARTADVSEAAQRPAEAPAQTADTVTADQYRPLGAEDAEKQPFNPAAEVPDSVVAAPEYRPLKAKKSAPHDAASEPGKAVARPADEADFQSQLETARQHYWRRDMRAAEQAYRRLSESHPQRAEVWGELGNLYYSQREMVQATDVYYRAIELLIEQGDTERARQMLGAMYQLDTDKARELEARLGQGGR